MKDKIKIVNRKAKFEYEFLDKYEAGIVLIGVEVKFIRNGHLSFADSFCLFQDNELYLKNVSISGIENDNIKRDRKLLLHRKELSKLQKQLIDGLTIVPYQIYENDRGIFKVEIVLAKGKKLYDKRETIKERDLKRGMNSDSTSGWYGC
jgi:SsrA-binding protein